MAAVAGLALILAGSWLAVGGRAKREREAAMAPAVEAACAPAEAAPAARTPAPVES